MDSLEYKLTVFLASFFLSCHASYSLQEMSLEEKVGQLLMVSFRGEESNEDARKLVQEIKVGGIIYYNWANGLDSPDQIRALSKDLQKLAKIPLFIAADQEGGVVSRLNSGFTKFPGNSALGETGDPTLARQAALATGLEMRGVGLNMNLAPVVDINCNPRNPVIGIRSFGTEAETVTAFGREALRGYREAHVIATLKHYPGHGDTSVDSHEELPVVHKSLSELSQVELLPFSRLGPETDAIMTAHILMPALDDANCSTLSKKSLDYLRNTIGFKGLIIADSLIMEGVTKKSGSVEEAAILALKAGCDILMLGGRLLEGTRAGFELGVADIQHVFLSLVEAVKAGRIPKARLDEAVKRILNLKKSYLTIDEKQEINWELHRKIAQEIASRSLKIIKNGPNFIAPIREKKIAILAPEVLRKTIEETTLLNIGKSTDCYYFDNLDIEVIKKLIEPADALLIFSYNTWKNPSQTKLIQSFLDLGKPAALIIARDPVDATLFPMTNLIFKTFSPTQPSLQAVSDRLVHNLFMGCQ